MNSIPSSSMKPDNGSWACLSGLILKSRQWRIISENLPGKLQGLVEEVTEVKVAQHTYTQEKKYSKES